MKEQDYLMVDLGLPSGIKWANKNVGAETPQNKGLYFSWGNVDGHTVDENGNVIDGYSFDENTYSTTLGGKYKGSTLDAEHDAATVNMGSDWRMPTSDETVELVKNTDHYYIGEDGNIVDESNLHGSKLRSICFVKKGDEFNYNNRTNFIEFPFAGYCAFSLFSHDGVFGQVWSSSIYDAKNACYFHFNCCGFLRVNYGTGRFFGFSVRGVTSNNKI